MFVIAVLESWPNSVADRLASTIAESALLRHWHGRNAKSENGLGLVGIDGSLPATILIGRRRDECPKFNAFRKQQKVGLNIEIHTYDWLVEHCESQVRV